MAFDNPEGSTYVSPPDALGRVKVVHLDNTLTVHMDWFAIKAMQSQWENDFLGIVSKAIDMSQIDAMAKIMSFSCTLDGEEERITERKALELGFPIVSMRGALASAWQAAWYGGEPPQEPEEGDEAKKTNPLATFLSRLSKMLSGQESNGGSSGS